MIGIVFLVWFRFASLAFDQVWFESGFRNQVGIETATGTGTRRRTRSWLTEMGSVWRLKVWSVSLSLYILELNYEKS